MLHYKLKFYLLLFLVISLANSGYAQTDLGDSSCKKCEVAIRQAMQNWNRTIINNKETAPISFVKLLKVDNEETKKLLLATLTADTTFIAYIYWHNNSEEIKFIRHVECFGKKVTTINGGTIVRRKFATKKEFINNITNHLNDIAYYYEVVYKTKDTTVSLPLLCLKTGDIIDSILSSSQYSNSNY